MSEEKVYRLSDEVIVQMINTIQLSMLQAGATGFCARSLTQLSNESFMCSKIDVILYRNGHVFIELFPKKDFVVRLYPNFYASASTILLYKMDFVRSAEDLLINDVMHSARLIIGANRYLTNVH